MKPGSFEKHQLRSQEALSQQVVNLDYLMQSIEINDKIGFFNI